jgi:hypothetical protein
MKQTAVQYFASKVMYLNISPKEMHDFLDWFEQAKEMERQQIVEAVSYCLDAAMTEEEAYKEGEQYFEETYK